ncbi:hypothetical protein ACFP8Z_21420 [Gemmobacter lanyuensis]|uniref:hypothetical protein n=1 Tax=Gemmobacter lanyuensis TaxID=1054497 RepID=UPI0036069E29
MMRIERLVAFFHRPLMSIIAATDACGKPAAGRGIGFHLMEDREGMDVIFGLAVAGPCRSHCRARQAGRHLRQPRRLRELSDQGQPATEARPRRGRGGPHRHDRAAGGRRRRPLARRISDPARPMLAPPQDDLAPFRSGPMFRVILDHRNRRGRRDAQCLLPVAWVRVDDDHVALSNQFFAKTAANVRANPQVTLILVDGVTGAQFLLDIRFVRSVDAGPLFDRIALQLKASSAQVGMAEVMRLKSADIFRVCAIERVPSPCETPTSAPHPRRTSAPWQMCWPRWIDSLAPKRLSRRCCRLSDPSWAMITRWCLTMIKPAAV